MDVAIAPRTIPEGEKKRVGVLTQATEPGRVLVSLSVQQEAIGETGIIRDQGPPFVIRNGRRGPVRVEDPARQRDGFLAVNGARDSHVARFQNARRDRLIVAITGCGNLQCNPGVEARAMGARSGIGGFMRAGIRVQPNGRGILIDGSRLDSALSTDAGTSAKSPDRFVITGPLLVAGGSPVDPDLREFADLRHLLLPAFVEVGPGRRVDFGFDALIEGDALAAAAVAGKPVTLPLIATLPSGDRVDAELLPVKVRVDAIRDALRIKGYRESLRVDAPGTFRIGAGKLTIAFLPGIYPHHALAIGKRGVVTSVIVTGRSNREGTTIRELAAALAKAGAEVAILLDNGGDVGLLRRKTASTRSPLLFAARPAEADRARAWPMRACLVYHCAKPRRGGSSA